MSANPGRHSQKLPVLMGLGIFSLHWVISYLVLSPGFSFLPCSDYLTPLLIGPGLLLSMLLYIPSMENTIPLLASAPGTVMILFAMTFTSLLYGLAGGFVFSFGKNVIQALGIAILGGLIVLGCMAVVVIGMPCA